MIAIQRKTKGLVNSLYKYMVDFSYLDLPLDMMWRKDYLALYPEFDWEDVWVCIKEASLTSDHQQIY